MIVSRPRVSVRFAASGDAEAIRSIYNVEVTESTVTFDLVPRTPAEQLAWLAEHDGVHPAVVAELGGEVVDVQCGVDELHAGSPRSRAAL